jgi:hypothetical protein
MGTASGARSPPAVTGSDSAARKRDVIVRFFRAFMGRVAETALGRSDFGP